MRYLSYIVQYVFDPVKDIEADAEVRAAVTAAVKQQFAKKNKAFASGKKELEKWCEKVGAIS